MIEWLLHHWYLYFLTIPLNILMMHYGAYPLHLYWDSPFTDFKDSGHKILLIALFGIPMMIFHYCVMFLDMLDHLMVNYF